MRSRYTVYAVLAIVPLALLAADSRWKALRDDGLHDPQSPAIDLLQEPADALSQLPPDAVGNRVSWIRALREGYIEPRTNIFPETKIEVIDLDIVMQHTGEMPLVLFSHRPHTEWLDCANCHDRIFIEQVDANPITMLAILNGEYCGVCHGAVSFPLTECNRCHSVDRATFRGNPGVQPTSAAGGQ